MPQVRQVISHLQAGSAIIEPLFPCRTSIEPIAASLQTPDQKKQIYAGSVNVKVIP
jgi:hypothetical protein